MSEQPARLTAALADRYRIERELGAGGMATVYLAHDLKHDRDVAIKVLHPDLGAALGSERFLSEIRTTARLQHPHILPLLDSGDADGLLYYVMPLVTGETLRARLERERHLPIPEAVRIAREVASALDYAHRQGVIHRDIKPENILLHDGQALVVDFGIALAVQTAGGQRMTQTGLSLGTPQYMSPEQAMGERTIDARSDIYALGAVTYEMLTGDPPFTGSTVQAIVAKILSADAERPTLIRKTIPAHVEDAVMTALARLPADRFATAAEFAEALENGARTTRRMARAADARPSRRSRAVLGVGAVSLLIIGAALGWMARRVPSAERPRVRIVLNPDSAAPPTVHECCASSVAMSPDGRFFAYTGRRAGQRVIVLRDRDGFAPKIGASADSKNPFFSPSGTELAFVQQGVVKGGTLTPSTSATAQPALVRITLPDGRPSVILSLPGDQYNLTGATWLPDGSIIFGRLAAPGLLRVATERGTVEVITTPDTAAGEMRHVSPFYVPEADGILFTIWPKTDSRADARIAFVSLRDRKVKVLGHGLSPQYTRAGYLVYATSDGRIVAQKTELPSGRVSGDVLRIAEGISVRGSWTADFAVSRDGALVYDQGSDHAAIDLVGPGGVARAVPISPEGVSHWDNPRFSPDGRFVAAAGSLSGLHQLFVLDLAGNAALRLTFEGQTEFLDWTTDSRSLVYVKAGTQLARQPADRSGAEKVLWGGDGGVIARVSVHGGWVAFAHTAPPGATGSSGWDIMVLQADSAAPRPYLATPYDETTPSISPDGRWLAYASTESGRSEVYVASFPYATAGRHAVSSDGGNEPQWSADGHTLYYRGTTTGILMAQEIRATPSLTLGVLRPVSNDLYERSEDGADYDVDPKGGRFVMTTIRTEGSRLTWILNAVPDR